MSDCEHALALLPQLVDGDLSSTESEFLSAHVATCRACADQFSVFAKVDAAITNRKEPGSPPPFGQRERLARQMQFHPARSRVWIWAATAAIAAGLLVFWFVGRESPVPASLADSRAETRFIEIPYLAPVAPNENTTVVRMDLQVATLQAAGYRVNADPGVTVPVDVLIGEDGRPHAVRVLADIDVNGAGD